MNILFVTLWPMESNTSAALRNHALIHGLLSHGCQIDVITVAAHQANPFFDKSLTMHERITWKVLDGSRSYAKVVSGGTGIISKTKQMLLPVARKLYHSLQLFDHSVFTAKNIKITDLPRDTYDLVISSSDPKTSHIAVQKLLVQGLKYHSWIQYWGDPLALDITRKHILPDVYVKKVEQSIIAGADRVIYVSPFTLNAQKLQFPNQADKMEWLPIPYKTEKRYGRQTGRRPLRIGYFGDYKSHVRNLLPLIDACRKHPEQFELIVAGNTDLQIDSDRTIQIQPRITQTEIEQLESSCDMLVCLLNRTGTQIPGKVYHYAATDKPILILLDGEHSEEMEQYFQRFDRYLCCPNQPEAIVQSLVDAAASTRSYEPYTPFAAATIAANFLNFAT